MTATATVAVGQELTAMSGMADPTSDDLAPQSADRRGPLAVEGPRRLDTSDSLRTSGRGCVTTDWEPYLADLRRRLDEVHASLSFAERQLGHDRGTGAPVMEVVGRPRRDASPDRMAVPPAVRLVREQWMAAVRKLDDLRSAASPPPLPVLDALGRERGLLRLARGMTHLSRRHTEILVILASHPHGMTTEELALALYGETGRPASARTALCRLRKDLAPWIHSERDRVKLEIEADFLVIQDLLRAGRAREAAQRYSAALLPRSEAPGVIDARDELDAWVRSAVMTSGDREALWAWLESGSGCDDVPAWKRFLADLDFADPRRPLAVSRLAGLRSTLTLVGPPRLDRWLMPHS